MGDLEVAEIFRAGALLVGSSESEAASDLQEVLQRRLTQYYSLIGKAGDPSDASLQDLQLRTAMEALYVLERLQVIWRQNSVLEQSTTGDEAEQGSPSGVAIGTRDLAQIRTLLSLVFKWAVEPLLSRIVGAIPGKSNARHHVRTGATIIDLTSVPVDYANLTTCVSRLVRLLFLESWQSPLLQTVITSALVNRHLTDLLRPCIVLGWLPKNLATESVRPTDDIRPFVVRLLSILPVSQTIIALGGIMSDSSLTLPYVRKSCGFLLSRQLLRPEGVAGLLAAVFGEEDVSGEDAPLEKLEHVGKLLTTVPASMQSQEYYGIIIPRLIAISSVDPDSDRVPPAHKRAVAFALSRMLVADQNPGADGAVSKILLSLLHRPFLAPTQGVPARTEGEKLSDSPNSQQNPTPSTSLTTLQTLLTNADPSPIFITSLLTPIVPPLYAILAHLERTRTSDPSLKESVRGLLSTWGRVVGAPEGIEVLWRVILGEGGEWRSDIAGNLTRYESVEQAPSLSLFTPQDWKRVEEDGEFDVDSNMLDLRPDPVRFVRFLKSIERVDISSELFVKLLEAYREIKAESDADPLRTLLYLQLILQMQNQLAADNSTSNILSKPDHILSFIKHALQSAHAAAESSRPTRKSEPESGLRMADLRIVEEEAEEELDDGDSDDEAPEASPGGSSDDEMVATAINLLLSIIEAHTDLSARTAPILNDIFSLLEPLSKDSSETIRPLAREARMVMTARLASTSMRSPRGKAKRSKDGEESPQEKYQKALKLLQDPLLPVRAHGLLLLRQLVSARTPPSPSGQTPTPTEPVLDRALVPGILSIFLQSAQDDDSYMFLNAVQGLAAMVDGFGRDVLRGLVNVYAEGLGGLGGTAMTQQDVDVRTRVGEALGQVIRRCGDALPAYVDILVPPLFGVMRATYFPTTLRTSAVSLLAQCAKTNSLAILPYAADLLEAMIDLLQVETVPSVQKQKKASVETVPEGPAVETTEQVGPVSMDAQPTSTNSKFPPLRRAALHFLSLLIQACISRLYESTASENFELSPHLVKRGKTTLGYVAATDEDGVVRVMARETLEALDQLSEAMMGL